MPKFRKKPVDEIDIFDIKNLDDLSMEVKKQLNKINSNGTSYMILSLFKIKNQLTLDEILVALSRKYSIVKTRMWLTSAICNLKKKGLIKKVEGDHKTYEYVE